MDNKELLEKLYELHVETLDRIGNINQTLAQHKVILDKQQESLNEHMRRTSVAEDR